MPVKNLRHLPKAHLHLHLEGAMRPATLTEFCERYKIKRPSDTRGKQFSNFAAFNEVYRAASDSIRTRQDLARVIQEVAEDAAKDGATWIEPAFDADRYTVLRADESLRLFETPYEGWLFALKAARNASEKTGVGISFISAIDRTRPIDQANERAKLTTNLIASQKHQITAKNINGGEPYAGIIGLGLHGNEEGYPPEIFAEAFQIVTKKNRSLINSPCRRNSTNSWEGPRIC